MHNRRLKVFAEWWKQTPQEARHACAVACESCRNANVVAVLGVGIEKITVEPDRVLKHSADQSAERRLVQGNWKLGFHSPVKLASVFGAVVASMVASAPTPACDFHVALLIVVPWNVACSMRVELQPLNTAASSNSNIVFIGRTCSCFRPHAPVFSNPRCQ